MRVPHVEKLNALGLLMLSGILAVLATIYGAGYHATALIIAGVLVGLGIFLCLLGWYRVWRYRQDERRRDEEWLRTGKGISGPRPGAREVVVLPRVVMFKPTTPPPTSDPYFPGENGLYGGGFELPNDEPKRAQ